MFEINSLNESRILKLKLTGWEEAALYPTLASFVAVTAQVVSSVAVNTFPLTEQVAPETQNETSPVPEPPVMPR